MDTVICDKAKYHYEGDFPKDLPIEQVFVHTEMFLGWVIENNLFSGGFEEVSQDEIKMI